MDLLNISIDKNMKLNFDLRGNLQPYRKQDMAFEDFRDNFVNPFGESSKRYEIFENYLQYINDFQEKITPNFTQWIDGSFVTNKNNPNDIDIVNLVSFEVVQQYEPLIRSDFIGKKLLKSHKIDAYLLIVYPENHKLHSWSKSDKLYWNSWFTKGKLVYYKNKKQRFPKGFIEINFESDK